MAVRLIFVLKKMEELQGAIRRGDECGVRRVLARSFPRARLVGLYHLAALNANASVVCTLIANGWRVPGQVSGRAYHATIHPVALHYQKKVRACARVVCALLVLARKQHTWATHVARQVWALRYDL